MPAEAQRLRRPVGTRDRRLVAAIVTATAIAVSAAAVLAEQSHHPGSAQCVKFEQAGVMGGGTWNLCGRAALTFCRNQSSPSADADVRARCAALRQQQQDVALRTGPGS